jgi:hypothetical protein
MSESVKDFVHQFFPDGSILPVTSGIMKVKYKGPYHDYTGPTGAAILYIKAF